MSIVREHDEEIAFIRIYDDGHRMRTAIHVNRRPTSQVGRPPSTERGSITTFGSVAPVGTDPDGMLDQAKGYLDKHREVIEALR